jgi:hypothetical protein
VSAHVSDSVCHLQKYGRFCYLILCRKFRNRDLLTAIQCVLWAIAPWLKYPRYLYLLPKLGKIGPVPLLQYVLDVLLN